MRKEAVNRPTQTVRVLPLWVLMESMTAPLLSVTVRPGRGEAGADGVAEPPSEEEEDSSGITGFSGSAGRGMGT